MSVEGLGRNININDDTKIKNTDKKSDNNSIQQTQEKTSIDTSDNNEVQDLKSSNLVNSLPQQFTDAMTSIFGESERVNGGLPFSDLTEVLPEPLKDVVDNIGGVVGSSQTNENVEDFNDATRKSVSALTSNPPDYSKFSDIALAANSKLSQDDKEKLFNVLAKSGKYFDNLKNFAKSQEASKLNPFQKIALDTLIKEAEKAKNNPKQYPENSYDSFVSKAMESLTSNPPDYKKFVKIARKANDKLSKEEKKNLVGLLANSGEILDGFKAYKKSGKFGFIENFAAKKILGKVEKYQKNKLD